MNGSVEYFFASDLSSSMYISAINSKEQKKTACLVK